MMRLKEGVNPFSLRPELNLAIFIGYIKWTKMIPHEFVITSLNDSVHSYKSLHYDGKAADIRTRDIPKPQVFAFINAWREALGKNPDFDILFEGDHIHIEYQPKYRGAT